ncbi:MAG TPA: arginase family protein [Streptosporangiaceae bacterium]|nr:arginase family protein [Streptosporangiaceae bacterium]
MPRYAIVEAPSALGHVPEHLGVERAPEVLLGAGLADGLAARRAGRVEAAGYSAERDSGTHIMNPQAIRDYSPLLADAVTAVLDAGEFPVVLGGDCSILLGTMLALRRRGRYGLLYIDGDADFYQPEVNPLGGAASASDLAFATGRGPDVVTDIEGRRPLVRAEDVVVFACRDAADRERRGCQPLPEDLLVIDRDQVRRVGAAAAAREAVRYLTREGGPQDGFWIHLDADVFDETIMPAVDDPRPDGLAWDEVVSALSIAAGSGHAVGLQVAIYNPDIDAAGSNGRGLAATVREAGPGRGVRLRARPRPPPAPSLSGQLPRSTSRDGHRVMGHHLGELVTPEYGGLPVRPCRSSSPHRRKNIFPYQSQSPPYCSVVCHEPVRQPCDAATLTMLLSSCTPVFTIEDSNGQDRET